MISIQQFPFFALQCVRFFLFFFYYSFSFFFFSVSPGKMAAAFIYALPLGSLSYPVFFLFFFSLLRESCHSFGYVGKSKGPAAAKVKFQSKITEKIVETNKRVGIKRKDSFARTQLHRYMVYVYATAKLARLPIFFGVASLQQVNWLISRSVYKKAKIPHRDFQEKHNRIHLRLFEQK